MTKIGSFGGSRRPPRATVADRLAVPRRGPAGRAALYRQIVQSEQRFIHGLEPRLRDITVPRLVLWGEHDQWIRIQQDRELTARIPDARFRIISGADHLIQDNAPAAVAVEPAAIVLDQQERLELP